MRIRTPIVSNGYIPSAASTAKLRVASNVLKKRQQDEVDFDFDVAGTDAGPNPTGLAGAYKWIHRRCAHFLNESPAGVYWDLIHTVLSLLSIALYLYECYAHLTPESPLTAWVYGMEIVFVVLFTVDLVTGFVAAEKKFNFLTSKDCILDTASILPAITLSQLRTGVAGPTLQFLRVLRFFRAIRLLEATGGGFHRRAANPDSSIRRQIIILISNVLAYIVFCAGLIHAAERTWPGTFSTPEQVDAMCDWVTLKDMVPSLRPVACTMDLFTSLYFTIITTLTVGFGDVIPSNSMGRAIVLGILLPMFLIVPTEASRLVSLMANVSKFTRSYTGSPHGHVILCGEVSGPSVYSFLNEWYHPDHGDQKMRVVILDSKEPDATTRAALDDPRFDQRCQYVRGNPLSSSDLSKAAVYDARAAFIIAGTSKTQDVVMADAIALLTVRIIKATCPWLPVHLQLIAPTSTIHTWAEWDQLVCAQELKYALLAKAALCPGFGAFVSNLLTSSSSTNGIDASIMDASDRRWMKEYLKGFGQELYCMPFSQAFSKQFFNVTANIAYQLWGVIIIGVETQRTRRRNSYDDIMEDITLSAEERAKKIAKARAKTLNLGAVAEADIDMPGDTDGDSAEARYRRLMEERQQRADAVVLINPKDYCIRAGDRAIIIAEDLSFARLVQDWDGTCPPEQMDAISITPTDKRTFLRMNGGHGPRLTAISPRFISPSKMDPLLCDEDGHGHISDTHGGEAPSSRVDARGQRPLSDRSSIGPSPLHAVFASPAFPLASGSERVAGLSATGSRRHSAFASTSPAKPPLAPPVLQVAQANPLSEVKSGIDYSHAFSRRRSRLVDNKLLRHAREFAGHVILCGPGLEDHLAEVLLPLATESFAPIVVLYPLEEANADAASILLELGLPAAAFGKVHMVDGSSINYKDLERAGITTAAVCIVLASGSSHSELDLAAGMSADLDEGGAASINSLAEIEALFTVCIIESKYPACRVLLEVASSNAMRYLAYKPYEDTLPRQLWPQYAAGRSFISSALGNLLVQAYYNPSLVPVLTKLIDPRGEAIRTQAAVTADMEDEDSSPAAGASRKRESFAGFIRQSKPKPAPGSAGTPRGTSSTNSLPLFPENGHAMHMAVPSIFVGHRFGDLFTELSLTRGVLVLGVYRSSSVHDSPLPYIITNPSTKMKLHAEDLLLVLVGDDLMGAAHRATNPAIAS